MEIPGPVWGEGPLTAAAFVAFFLLRDVPASIQGTVLVVAGGVLAVASIEDMLREAHEARAEADSLTLSLVLGFAVFALVAGL